MSSLSRTFLILTSPPASGKTYWIHSYQKTLVDSLLVISPLRALRDECQKKWGDEVLVMTPEEWLTKKTLRDVVVIDEFHLWFHWGDSFRPLLWDVFFEIAEGASLVIGLSATLSDEYRSEIRNFSSHFDRLLWVNCGNFELKNRPQRTLVFKDKKTVLKAVLADSSEGCRLVFCRRRKEVEETASLLRKKGKTVLTCLGGESRYFADKLAAAPSPEFIVSTTVLSHGVNLPKISRIFFLYRVESKDFWIQMAARGGRRGEPFDIVGMERPVGGNYSRIQNLVGILLMRLRIFFVWPFP